ncbi:MAG: 50S ribosomal protein L23 [Candidatus Uhrbacteria bacterium]
MSAFLKKRTPKPTDDAAKKQESPVVSSVADATVVQEIDKPKHGVEGRAASGAERDLLIEPYLTEKSSTLAELGQYTFLVRNDAEKVAIMRAIAQRYGVHPEQVRIIRTSGRAVRYGRSVGRRSGTKKAIVRLRAGETLPFGART